jgi:HlyD family secretion protein
MKMKLLLALLVAGTGALLLALAMGWFSNGLTVAVARAQRGPIEEFVDEQAVTRLPNTYLITMPFASRIEPVVLVEGTRVRQGQAVAQLVPQDLDLAVEEAQAMVDRLEASVRHNADMSVEQTGLQQAEQYVDSMKASVAASAAREESGKAKFDFAERILARGQRLLTQGAESQERLEQMQLDRVQSDVGYRQDMLIHAAMRSLQAATNLMPTMVRQYIARKLLNQAVIEKEKAEARARLERAQLNRKRGTITSPVDGIVLQRYVTNERYLAGGTQLLEIGRLEDLEVEADVLSLDVVDVKLGDRVEIYGPAVGLPRAEGAVRQIYPAGFTKISSLGVEQQRVKVVIAFRSVDLRRLLDQRHLGVGYRVRVKIVVRREPKALVIPRAALFRSAEGAWTVFAVRDGRTQLVALTTGLMNDQWAEVRSGLSEGDLVVAAPENNLEVGQRVTPLPR